jgi:hypothetical protein
VVQLGAAAQCMPHSLAAVVVVPARERFNHMKQERMVWRSCHHIIGESCGVCLWQCDAMLPEAIQAPLAAHIQVQVDATIAVESKVAQRIHTLYRVGVAVVAGQEPRVLLGDELSCTLVCPEHVPAVLAYDDVTCQESGHEWSIVANAESDEVGWSGSSEGQGRAGQGRAGQGRAGQGRAGQGRAGQGRAGQHNALSQA